MEDSTNSFSDGDDVYYRFRGAAICSMLKSRYKAIKNAIVLQETCLEISILQATKLKHKSTYLSYRDRGFLYFPDTSLLPFLRKFNDTLKVVNEEGFCQHGNNLVKVCAIIFRVTISYVYLIINSIGCA